MCMKAGCCCKQASLPGCFLVQQNDVTELTFRRDPLIRRGSAGAVRALVYVSVALQIQLIVSK